MDGHQRTERAAVRAFFMLTAFCLGVLGCVAIVHINADKEGSEMSTKWKACPSCDDPVKPDARFCSGCGASFGDAEATPEEKEAARKSWLKKQLEEFGLLDGGDGGEVTPEPPATPATSKDVMEFID